MILIISLYFQAIIKYSLTGEFQIIYHKNKLLNFLKLVPYQYALGKDYYPIHLVDNFTYYSNLLTANEPNSPFSNKKYIIYFI